VREIYRRVIREKTETDPKIRKSFHDLATRRSSLNQDLPCNHPSRGPD
jgi:hypothetical protein